MRQSFWKGQSSWSQDNLGCRCRMNFLLGLKDSSLELLCLKLSAKWMCENLKQVQSWKRLIITLSTNFIRLQYRNIIYLETTKISLESSGNHRLPILNWNLISNLKPTQFRDLSYILTRGELGGRKKWISVDNCLIWLDATQCQVVSRVRNTKKAEFDQMVSVGCLQGHL